MSDDILVELNDSDNILVNLDQSDDIVIQVNEIGYGTINTSDTSTIDMNFAAGVLSASFNPTANVSLNSYKITSLADPTSNQDAATKAYVDTQVGAENLWDRSGTTLSPRTVGDSIDVLGLIKSSRDGTPSQYLSMTAGTAAGPVIEANGTNKQLTISNSSTGGIYFNTIGFGQALYINNSGATNVLLTTDSTSSSTGALIVSGGVGIAKNLVVDTNTFYVDATANKVGIGTASPVRKLHIHESDVATNGSPLVKVTTNISGATDGDGFAVGLDSANTGYIINYEAAPLTFLTNASERMRIDSSGNVGIGAVSPGLLGVTKELTLEAKSPGNQVAINISGYATTNGSVGGFLQYYNNGNRVAYIGSVRLASSDSSSGLIFTTANAGTLSERMRVDNTGNVGIGTSNPLNKLDVQTATDRHLQVAAHTSGTSIYAGTDADAYTVLYADGSTLALNTRSSGNVGIRVTSPVSPLHVYGTQGSPSLSANTANINTIESASNAQLATGAYSSSPYAIWMQVKDRLNNGSSYPLVLNPIGGNVGIGTTNPGVKLEVAGVIKTTDTTASTSTITGSLVNAGGFGNAGAAYIGGNLVVDTDSLFVDSSANKVGILNAGPQASLHIGPTTATTQSGTDLLIVDSAPKITFVESDQSADSRVWDILTDVSAMKFRINNDADSISTTWLQASRSGTSVSSVSLTGGYIDAVGTLRVSNTAGSIYYSLTSSNNSLTFNSTGSNGRYVFQNAGTERIRLDSGTGAIGLLTNSPGYSLTIASAGNGIALYNTADETTNYERGILAWSSNQFIINAISAGTGTTRNLVLSSVTNTGSSSALSIRRGGTSDTNFTFTASASGSAIRSNLRTISSISSTSGTYVEVEITPTIGQTSTAGYTALLINPTETTTGSGSKLFADFQIGGTTRFSVSNTGDIAMGYSGSTTTINFTGSLGQLQTAGANYIMMNGGSGKLSLGNGISTGNTYATISEFGLNSSSNQQKAISAVATVSQSATAGYTAYFANITESSTGSGAKLLMDLQVGGVSKVNISNSGLYTSTSKMYLQTSETIDTIQFGGSRRYGMGVSSAYTAIYHHNAGSGIQFGAYDGSTFTGKVMVSTSSLSPISNDGYPLGTATVSWSDLFLASGAVIGFANSNVTITHSTGYLNMSGNLGMGIAPTAYLHLKAGTAAAATAPLKFTAGTLNTTPELGAVEFVDNGTTGKLYITVNVAGVLTRKEIAFV